MSDNGLYTKTSTDNAENNNASKKSQKEYSPKRVIIVFLLLSLIGFIFFHSSAWKKAYIKWQFKNMYNLDVNTKTIHIDKGDGSNFAISIIDKGMYNQFLVDSNATVVMDKYINIYYADELVNQLHLEIDDITDCYVVDCLNDYNLKSIITKSNQSFDEYKNESMYHHKFNIYVKKECDDATINKILCTLRDSEEDYNFTIIKVDNDWYNMLVNSNIYYFWNDNQVIYDLGYETYYDDNNAKHRELIDFTYYNKSDRPDSVVPIIHYRYSYDKIYMFDENGKESEGIDASEYLSNH